MIQLPHSPASGDTLRDLAPDLTPMLDILFILLVFFMLTAGTVFRSLDLNLPVAAPGELTLLAEPRHIMVEIHAEHYVVDGRVVEDFPGLTQVLPPLVEANPEHTLVIAGERTISIERLLKVLGHLQAQGIEAADILMRGESSP